MTYRNQSIFISQSKGGENRVSWIYWYILPFFHILLIRHLTNKMERIHQLHVVPDLIPSLQPSFDLRISFPGYSRCEAALNKSSHEYWLLEPGVFLFPEQVCLFSCFFICLTLFAENLSPSDTRSSTSACNCFSSGNKELYYGAS